MGTDKNGALAFLQNLIKVFDVLKMDMRFNERRLQTPGHSKEFQQVSAKIMKHSADLAPRHMVRLQHYFQVTLNRLTIGLGKTKMQITQKHDQGTTHLNR
jgi:hypothetical protein